MMALFNKEQVLEAYVEEERQAAAKAAAKAATEAATNKERENGIIRLIELCKEFGLSLAETVSKVAMSYNLSLADSTITVKKYW